MMNNNSIPDPQLQEGIEDSTAPAAPQREGLVSYQQSLKPARHQSGAEASTADQLHETAERRAALRTVGDQDSTTGPARWRVTLENGGQTITVDSHQSRLSRCQRRVHAWASALPRSTRLVRRAAAKMRVGPRMVMLTLTYAQEDGWEANQIRDFLVNLRQLLNDNLYGYAWVMEMQKRGAPHYHVILYVKRGTRIPKPDEKLWSHGMSRIETVRSPFYICKYTSKAHQKAYQKEGLPPGARMFAVKIYNSDIPADELFTFRISAAPAWLRPHLIEAREQTGTEIRYARVKGGGWVIKETGEVLCSKWKVLHVERVL